MFLLVLIPFALVLVVLSVLGLAGIGLLGDERRAERSGAAGALGPVVGLLIGGGMLVLAVAGAFALVGLGGGDESDERHRETGTAAASDSTSRATTPEHPETRAPTLGAAVRIEADAGATFPVSYDVADRLAPDTVLPIHVVGFGPFAAAVAEQCAPSLSRRCENQIAVQFDADGEAHFQYLVSDEFLEAQAIPGRCRADAAPCTIVVRTADGERRGSIQTIFVDAIPVAGRIEVTPSTGLSLDGERVTVTVHDYPPGGEVAAMLCAAPDATGSRCGAPGPTARIAVGADGTGRAELVVTPGPVGEEGVPCSRGDDCGISVASADVFARAPVVPIAFAAPPGADYDGARLALGLAVAGLLLGLAAALLLRTDWAPVGEAAAPEIDDAEYADLDAIIAALPPEEDELVGSP